MSYDTLALLMAVAGLAVAMISFYNTAKLRREYQTRLAQELQRLVEDNAAVWAAMSTPRHVGQPGDPALAEVIRRRARKQFQRAGVANAPEIDFEQLSVSRTVAEYYATLENLYFSSPRNLAILSKYARELVHSDHPVVALVDLVAFGHFRREQGVSEAGRVLEDVRKVVFGEVAQRSGSILSSLGDAILVVFKSADAALDASIAIQRALNAAEHLAGVKARVAIGVADWQRAERLKQVYEVEAATSPGSIGIASSLFDWVREKGVSGSRRIATSTEGERPLEFVELFP